MNFNLTPNTALTVDPVFDFSGRLTSITVKRNQKKINYHRTNRGLAELSLSLSDFNTYLSMISGRRFLDLGTGDGKLVSELLDRGVLALGLDLYLNEQQKKQEHFILGDAFNLPFQAQVFEAIHCSYSVFHYEPLSHFPQLFREIHRVSQKGCVFLIPFFDQTERRNFLMQLAKKAAWKVFEDRERGTLMLIK